MSPRPTREVLLPAVQQAQTDYDAAAATCKAADTIWAATRVALTEAQKHALEMLRNQTCTWGRLQAAKRSLRTEEGL